MMAPVAAPIAPPMRAPSPARLSDRLPMPAPTKAPVAPPSRAPLPVWVAQPVAPRPRSPITRVVTVRFDIFNHLVARGKLPRQEIDTPAAVWLGPVRKSLHRMGL